MKYKILIHAPILSSPGGKQNYFAALRSKFQHEVHFFFYGAKGKKERFFTVPIRLIRDYWKFYWELKKNNYDLVHLNPSLNPKSFFRDSIFAFLGYLAGTKMIVFWRGWRWDFEKKYVGKIVPFFRMTYGRATAMICLANDFARRLREYGYKNPVYLETTVVEDAIINGEFPDGSLEQQTKDITLLFLSRVEKAKGIYETIDSFQNLLERHENIKLHIAGTGKELVNVKAYVTQKNIPNVSFLGWVDGHQKAEALSNSDIFVLASYTEGMPNCILEAMAMGKAIVTTEVGGLKDFFEHEKMGLNVKIKDSNDLEQKLEKLLLKPSLIEQMGAFNRSYARELFAATVVCERLENIYEATIKGADYKHSYPVHQ
ncbi:MAG: glycosyltransferase family 4 protein [Flavobacteriaceae bacterium]